MIETIKFRATCKCGIILKLEGGEETTRKDFNNLLKKHTDLHKKEEKKKKIVIKKVAVLGAKDKRSSAEKEVDNILDAKQ